MENNFYYCERNTTFFLAEPLNLFTNLSFLVVAVFLFFDKSIKNKNYSIMIFLIGVGSISFHSFPNTITGLADIGFIILFIYYYLYSLYKLLGVRNYLVHVLSIFFIIVCYFFGAYFNNTFLGSSSFYTPILIHLYFLCFYFLIHKYKNYQYNLILKATLIFNLSILLRSLDFYLCNILYFGTHFIWHILNSLVLFLLVKFINLIAGGPSPKKPT